jgi:hypothetical protein
MGSNLIMPTLEIYKGAYLWKYIPNLAAAVTFAILFLILTLVHTYKTIKHRTWYTIPFLAGGICTSHLSATSQIQ